MVQFDKHVFQMGWFNHQPVKLCRKRDSMQKEKRQTNPGLRHLAKSDLRKLSQQETWSFT